MIYSVARVATFAMVIGTIGKVEVSLRVGIW